MKYKELIKKWFGDGLTVEDYDNCSKMDLFLLLAYLEGYLYKEREKYNKRIQEH